ncbi:MULTISPECIES: DUF262 domain-containing protein [Methylobacterium]|uniref:HNH endonuclease family protein n=1 Tax=Methylobacterium TaxID=407 RepID=UPI0008E585B8|nr:MULTISPECIES: DUF262 domain-containing protein [Methylobacterium]MBZ6414324.1 HNH endonuclease [Methylobacterium sp.]SFF72878.1 HNH endonuclease [Methylobacterium sp. yr596]
MASRVNLDAMIQREDFATEDGDYTMDLFQNFPASNLEMHSPVRRLLRKPDFQRETNHWSPNQLVTFVASFLDNELIPSLILWKSSTYIFVIDGGHRLSALRAWMEDDYGDGPISRQFYNGEISAEQKRIAKRTRSLIESKIGRFSKLKGLVGTKLAVSDIDAKRSQLLFTRGLNLQWVQGTASVAETSFFKINSQGTPLDDTEELLLRNRKKPIAIGARAILRAGVGHKYWSAFDKEIQAKIEKTASEIYAVLFEPEINQPIKTLDLPLGGTVAPTDALALLVDFLFICDSSQSATNNIASYDDDEKGDKTITVLASALSVVNRITGNAHGSLGLHPAVYFYNEKGKHSRFLFLGMVSLISSKLKNNDSGYFKKFTISRRKMEDFLVENKSLIGILLQNMNRSVRIAKMKDLLEFLIDKYSKDREVKIEEVLEHLGARGRILDITTAATNVAFSDDTKSAIFVRRAIDTAMRCSVCSGLLDPAKSVSYDHKIPVRDGGTGALENGDLIHPYCNQSIKQQIKLVHLTKLPPQCRCHSKPRRWSGVL